MVNIDRIEFMYDFWLRMLKKGRGVHPILIVFEDNKVISAIYNSNFHAIYIEKRNLNKVIKEEEVNEIQWMELFKINLENEYKQKRFELIHEKELKTKIEELIERPVRIRIGK